MKAESNGGIEYACPLCGSEELNIVSFKAAGEPAWAHVTCGREGCVYVGPRGTDELVVWFAETAAIRAHNEQAEQAQRERNEVQGG